MDLLDIQGFENIIKIMCKSGLPTNIPLGALSNDERFSHHEMDIMDGAFLLEDDGTLSDFSKIYDLTLKELHDLLDISSNKMAKVA